MKIQNLAIILWVLSCCGCGVKGDPLPPEKPPELWRPGQRKLAEPPRQQLPKEERLQPPAEDEENSDGSFF